MCHEALYDFDAILQIPVKTVNVVYTNTQVDFATLPNALLTATLVSVFFEQSGGVLCHARGPNHL